MADGVHTQLKRGSWTRGIGLSTAGGYRRASRRRGVSFTIELVIRALASGLLGLDGTGLCRDQGPEQLGQESLGRAHVEADTGQLRGRGVARWFVLFVATMPALGHGLPWRLC